MGTATATAPLTQEQFEALSDVEKEVINERGQALQGCVERTCAGKRIGERPTTAWRTRSGHAAATIHRLSSG
jgi:hypothetical protein